jgi:phosphatidylserine/phosphatidylglycerophosphate/cardiolipin synthase-like enzyme
MTGNEWFSTDLIKGLSRIYNNSHVQAFVDAEEYYVDLRKEVEATGKGGLIYWIGFEAGNGDAPMPRAAASRDLKSFPPRSKQSPPPTGDKTWLELLTAASDEREVAIRALLNLHPKPDLKPGVPKKYKEANFDLVEKLNALQNCLAINDFRYLHMNGTHHQKLVLVYSERGLMAYVGTCDVELSRIENRWCEVHCKIMGDVAVELYEVFSKRWIEHTAVFDRAGFIDAKLKPISELKLRTPSCGNFLMQVSTTYGNAGRLNPFNTAVSQVPPWQVVNQPHRVNIHTKSPLLNIGLLIGNAPFFFGNDFFTEVDRKATLPIQDAARQNRTYTFAPSGHTGIYQAIKKAIETAEQYIYVEDQYLVNDVKMGPYASILDLLVDKLRSSKTFKKLIIFCTRIDDINDEFQGTGWGHRRNFIRSLVDAGHEKVVVCQYKSRGALKSSFGQAHQGAFYIHSKTWIFDDVYLITGSANCNRRGYSHDSELDVGVYDQDKRFVRELRVKMWKNRLNTQGISGAPLQDAQLNDFLSAARYWETPDKFGLTIESNFENSRSNSLGPTKYPDLDINSYKGALLGSAGMGLLVGPLLDQLKMEGLWNFVVDPDGA